MYVWTYTCMYGFMYVCMYVCMCGLYARINKYIHTYVCMHAYIRIHTEHTSLPELQVCWHLFRHIVKRQTDRQSSFYLS